MGRRRRGGEGEEGGERVARLKLQEQHKAEIAEELLSLGANPGRRIYYLREKKDGEHKMSIGGEGSQA